MNTEELRIKVEQFGVWFEKRGWSPISGRIFGYLLLSDPPHRTMDEIEDFLQISKSGISTNLKKLIEKRIVDYRTFPGNRKRYFQIDTEEWLKRAKNTVTEVTDVAEVIEKAIKNRSENSNTSFNEGIQKIASFYNHLAEGINKSIKNWEKQSV